MLPEAARVAAGPAAARAAGAIPAPPGLVGREFELATLREAALCPPALVLVEGDAGFGKTRLLQELLADPALTTTTALTGRCSPLREPLPLAPLLEALLGAAKWLPPPADLPAVTGALRPLLPELADQLPPELPVLTDHRQERHRVFRGIRELLAGLGPTVLVLEDLQWIDGDSQELLRFLADRSPPRLSLVLTYRREDLPDPRARSPLPPARTTAPRRLVLPPLERAEVAALLATAWPAAPAMLARTLHQHTSGIPLAVTAALQLLRREHRAGATPELPAELPVPDTLRHAVLERVGRLSHDGRQLLYAAAALGRPATEQALAELAEVTPPHRAGALAELVRRGLLRPMGGEQYGFRHRLALGVVQEALPEAPRRNLHRRVTEHAAPAVDCAGCALRGTALLHDYAVGAWAGLAARAGELATASQAQPVVAAEARLVLGMLALAEGRLREAGEHLTRCSQYDHDTDSVPVAVAGHGGLARLAAANGDLGSAQALAQRSMALVRDHGLWCWAAELLPTAVAVLVRAPGGLAAADTLVEEVAAGLAGDDSPLAGAAVLAGRALLVEARGALPLAAAQHAEAAAAYQALPRPYAAGQAWEDSGRCLLAAGGEGSTALLAALQEFERLGAGWDVQRCRRLLGGPQAVPYRRGRRGYGGALSPREQEVVRLVRQGMTNREVAGTLFLSPRTVEAHVARVLRKLGLPSRRALASSGPDAGG